uniref:PIN domain-containing protein n=1 Tax=Halorubrum sp. DTA98 TaxID=3402163 RepID=UPI003AAB4273
MKLVIDANVVISALIADSKTRELIVTLEPDLLTPAFVHDEIENYQDLIVEKSGMKPTRVAQFMEVSRLKPRPSGRGYSRQLCHYPRSMALLDIPRPSRYYL